MVDFGIRRLAPFENASRYHLYNDEGQLVLVADHRSPWLPEHASRQVRFANPDGSPLASLDLPQILPNNGRVSSEINYAIIFDYAVYAIISEINPSAGITATGHPYYTLELEGKNWLALPVGKDGSVYALYDNLPTGFNHHVQLDVDDLPEPTGFIRRDTEGFDFVATIPLSKLRQRELVSMAMVFLIDNFTSA
jgi:hypothetical protein